jgi:hypothetical protein
MSYLQVGEIVRNPMAKSSANPASLRLAINAKCYECFGGSIFDPQTRQGIIADIRRCSANQCPLYAVRWRGEQ